MPRGTFISELLRRWRLRRRAAKIAASPLFDADWYRERFPDVREASIDPALHYVADGGAEGRWPGPLFDPAWYMRQADVAERLDQTPLEHYLACPEGERCSPHPLFDPDWYRANNPDVAEAGIDVLENFIESGGREGRSPHLDFDAAWYLARYPDVAKAGVNPLVHYLENGASEGRDPNPDFSTESYLARYPDVAKLGVNPLVHFVATGRREGRVAEPAIRDQGPVDSNRDACLASGLFDPAWYKAAYADIADAGIDPLGHYLATGAIEGRNPSPWFDTSWYVSNYPEAAESGMNPLVHYQRIGCEKGFLPRAAPKNGLWGGDSSTRDANDSGERSRPERESKPRILFVIAALYENSGTTLTNRDLMDALQREYETLLLRSDGRILELFIYRGGESVLLDYSVLDDPIRPLPHTSDTYDKVVSKWLDRTSVELIHVRHIALHGLGIVDMARNMNIPVIFSFHDYYTVCPTVKLLDENMRYCSGRCTPTPGPCVPELFPKDSIPELKNSAVHDWKMILSDFLAKCDALITTSRPAREVVLSNFPGLEKHPFHVIAHGRDFRTFRAPGEFPVGRETLRLVVPGNIAAAKGAAILLELDHTCLTHDIEIHVLGRWLYRENPENIIVHGEYSRQEFVERIAEMQPHIGLVLSIWAETWCHTLTELWAAGMPVIGTDLGAVGERIQENRAGWVLPEMSAVSVIELISRLREDPVQYSRVAERIPAVQENLRNHDCDWMARQYSQIYRCHI